RICLKEGSEGKSKALHSLPKRQGWLEWASELETKVMPSREEIRQFIAGSDDIPVSIAKMLLLLASYASFKESKPLMLPKTPNQGVQAWQGIMKLSFLSTLSTISTISEGKVLPKVGLPSASKFPFFPNKSLICETISSEGQCKRWCTFFTPFGVDMIEETSFVKTKQTPLSSKPFKTNSPSLSEGISLVFNSLNQAGCEKSPVPSIFKPFCLAPSTNPSKLIAWETAREYLECK
ncbi:MAG TPA: hypothetical protein VI874_00935, partial [Candidatus Norongarragalinales archaeon]|nr:hypothetical protein [Candidatus Norongarragalinales archaeon]